MKNILGCTAIFAMVVSVDMADCMKRELLGLFGSSNNNVNKRTAKNDANVRIANPSFDFLAFDNAWRGKVMEIEEDILSGVPPEIHAKTIFYDVKYNIRDHAHLVSLCIALRRSHLMQKNENFVTFCNLLVDLYRRTSSEVW